jgi:hypothetical protein
MSGFKTDVRRYEHKPYPRKKWLWRCPRVRDQLRITRTLMTLLALLATDVLADNGAEPATG